MGGWVDGCVDEWMICYPRPPMLTIKLYPIIIVCKEVMCHAGSSTTL